MGLESATFINGLTAAWPISSDPKSQGDDHLRLVKGALQATFPTATQALYFPKTINIGTQTLTDSFQNSLIYVSTAPGDVTITLPTLPTSRNGWMCDIIKVTTDANTIRVIQSGGGIFTPVGNVADVRIGSISSPVRFVWVDNGSWISVRTGELIGSSMNWDGPSVPPGYLTLDGSTFSSSYFAELYLAMGSNNVLRDKQGRVEVGVDGVGRLGGLMGGTSGSVGGAATHILTLGELPTGITSSQSGLSVSVTGESNVLKGATAPFNTPGTGAPWLGFNPGAPPSSGGISASGSINVNTTSNNTGGAGHAILQPTIVTRKLIRAC